MLRKKFEHGFNEQDWHRAKQEALDVLKKRARRGDPITYSDLVEKVASVHMDAHDVRLAHFLGEIAVEEHECGRPLITALVVHKHDGQPGKGFFELARLLKIPVVDELAFWSDQIEQLRRQWG